MIDKIFIKRRNKALNLSLCHEKGCVNDCPELQTGQFFIIIWEIIDSWSNYSNVLAVIATKSCIVIPILKLILSADSTAGI